MIPRRIRLVAALAALAAFVAVLAPSASAQSGPAFLPGQWAGEMWFDHEIRGGAAGAGTGSQHVGSGGLELLGTLQADGSTFTEGTVAFAVLVRAFSDIAKSERLYDAEWQVSGSSSEIAVRGDVTASGFDSLRAEADGPFTDVGVNFVSEGSGTLDVSSASCASVSGTFTATLIANDKDQAVVGVTAPFWAVRASSEELREHWQKVQAAADELFFTDGAGQPSVDDIVTFVDLIQELNQLIVGADYCGKGRGTPVPGWVHEFVAISMGRLLQAVMQDSAANSAEDYIYLYSMAANLGAFAVQNATSSYVQENMPDLLGFLNEQALLQGELDTVAAIHAAACQFGWADLKRQSTVSQ